MPRCLWMCLFISSHSPIHEIYKVPGQIQRWIKKESQRTFHDFYRRRYLHRVIKARWLLSIKTMHYLRRDSYASIIFIIIDQVDILFGGRLAVTIHGGNINNYVRREDFMPRQNLYIARRIYASLEFMHRGIMHRGNHASRVNNHAWREDFMPRRNLYIARRIYASLEFMHRGIMHRESIIMHDEKISCLVEIYTSREEFMPR